MNLVSLVRRESQGFLATHTFLRCTSTTYLLLQWENTTSTARHSTPTTARCNNALVDGLCVQQNTRLTCTKTLKATLNAQKPSNSCQTLHALIPAFHLHLINNTFFCSTCLPAWLNTNKQQTPPKLTSIGRHPSLNNIRTLTTCTQRGRKQTPFHHCSSNDTCVTNQNSGCSCAGGSTDSGAMAGDCLTAGCCPPLLR